jgi:hypothetical protein
MQQQFSVEFQEVRANFLRENSGTPDRNGWPLGALEAANRQFGCWTLEILSPEEVRSVMLPWHSHGVNLVPPEGLAVSEALKRLAQLDQSSECHRRIQQFSDPRTPAVFLSVAPIDDPNYTDYKGLVDRGYQGLTHLDGLHRLIAWGRENKRTVPAYVAGTILIN